MATLADIRQQYPQYSDMSDSALADALYQKFYADMPRGDFDAKLGIKAEAPAPAAPDVGMSTAIGRGAAQGLTLGGYDELRGLSEAGGVQPNEPMSLASLIRGGYNLFKGSGNAEYKAGRDRALAELKTAETQYPISTAAGNLGGAFGSALAAAPVSLGVRAAGSGAGLLRTALGSAVDGAVMGAGQGALSADEGKRLEGAGVGTLTGAVIGGAAPVAVSTVSNLFRRALTPFPTTPQRTAAAQYLAGEGVPVTAGQRTGSRTLRYVESELGGDAAGNLLQNQGDAFTDAVMRRAGGSGLATPENLDTLRRSIGNDFNWISARNTMVADRQFGQDVGNTLNRYDRLLEAQQKPIINGIADDVIERLRANGGRLPGTEYQAIRSDLTTAAQSTSNQALAGAFRGLRNALDSAMERSILPADAGRWGELRRQYGNMKVIQRASLGGGEDAGLGIISPARLRMAASTGNQSGFATGASDFTQLAKAGQAVMTPLPQSGTAPRLRAQNLGMSFLPTILGSAGGSAYGSSQDGARGAILGALLGAAAPRVLGSAVMSGRGQQILANQRFVGPASPESQAIASLLLGRALSSATNRR